jgi:hypothetical protein
MNRNREHGSTSEPATNPPHEGIVTSFVMAALPLRHQSPHGDGAYCDSTGTGTTALSHMVGAGAAGAEPESGLFTQLIFSTSIN